MYPQLAYAYKVNVFDQDNSLIWFGNCISSYLAISGYTILRNSALPSLQNYHIKHIWKTEASPQYNGFFWLTGSSRIASYDN